MKINQILDVVFKWIMAPVVLLWALCSMSCGDDRRFSEILIDIWSKIDEKLD